MQLLIAVFYLIKGQIEKVRLKADLINGHVWMRKAALSIFQE